RSAMAMANMKHGYGGNLHRGGSGPSWEHGYGGGPPSQSQRSTMVMVDMEHGYEGNLHRGCSGPPWEHGYGGDLHRGRSGLLWPWRTWSMAMRGTFIAV